MVTELNIQSIIKQSFHEFNGMLVINKCNKRLDINTLAYLCTKCYQLGVEYEKNRTLEIQQKEKNLEEN
jgi:hypothetical protein